MSVDVDKNDHTKDNFVTTKGTTMWLEKLKELKKEAGMSVAQIAHKGNISEKTVARVFSGDTDRPYMDTLYDIVSALGGSLDDIFAEGKARLASEELITVQNELERVRAEKDMLSVENTVLKDKANALTAENDILKMQLAHKDELLSLHNYYRTIISGKE